jgi:DNA-binding MarR family transcriptional regulator
MRVDRDRHAISSDAALEKRRSRGRGLRRLLIAATRTINLYITEELQRQGYANARPGHSALLANLDFEGNTVTEIAARAQISRQAMSRLAVELEKMGLITRVQNETDARALTLRFTRAGKALVRASILIVDDFERELIDVVGSRALANAKRTLSAISASRWA